MILYWWNRLLRNFEVSEILHLLYLYDIEHPLRFVYTNLLVASNSRRSRVQDLAAADNIFLLALGMEIMKYTLENIFHLSYYGVNNNTA
jgi:hypothetical protein